MKRFNKPEVVAAFGTGASSAVAFFGYTRATEAGATYEDALAGAELIREGIIDPGTDEHVSKLITDCSADSADRGTLACLLDMANAAPASEKLYATIAAVAGGVALAGVVYVGISQIVRSHTTPHGAA